MATTTHLVTAEELMQLSGNGRYELVQGELLTIAFIRKDRNPPRSTGYAEMAPDLAVEVNSSTKNRRYVERKAAQWLSFGVQSVWLVSCKNRTVEVLSANGSRVLFAELDELTDEDVLPGFRVRVAEIFN